MPFSHRGERCLLYGILVLALTAALGMAQQPRRPDSYAIRGARIVPVSGPAIESATVVVRDGLITAVSESAEIPADAWVIEGEGLTVYPGFIDAMSHLGMPSPPRGGGNDLPMSLGPQDRPGTTPWVTAADVFQLDNDAVSGWRGGGFTSLALTPRIGIFPGWVSLVNLGEGRPGDQVVADRAALVIRFSGEGYRGFPSNVLGYTAYARQIFSDARQAAEANRIYTEDPRGLERPSHDRTLAPLMEAIDRDVPILFPADNPTEIHRAIDLRPDIGGRLVVYGARNTYEGDIAAAASEAGLEVLLNADWPEARRGEDPETDTPFRVLEFRQKAPSSAAALAAADVRFAWYFADADNPRKLLDAVRKAVDAGLDHDRAIRALTLDAASMYGVDNRLGSIEAGKIANLAVFAEDPLAEGVKPKMVFVDGVKYEVIP